MLFVYSTIFVLGDVRLVGTGLKHVGKVELRYQGEWGTICGSSTSYWDKSRRSRDLSNAWLQSSCSTYIYRIEGKTPRRMLMYKVGCSGNEKSIADCTHNGWWSVPSVSYGCTTYPNKLSCWCALPERWR